MMVTLIVVLSVVFVTAFLIATATRKPICTVYGHRPAFGYGDHEGYGYFDVRLNTVDGIGRQHADLYTFCERCGVKYHVGMIHVPKV
jgi:hypothetical protein